VKHIITHIQRVGAPLKAHTHINTKVFSLRNIDKARQQSTITMKTIRTSSILIILMALLERTLCMPTTSDGSGSELPATYVINGQRVLLQDIPKHIRGGCQLYKATMEFGQNKLKADFCGGGCQADESECSVCQPTESGKKTEQVTIVNKDGSTETKAWQVITACECAKTCQVEQ